MKFYFFNHRTTLIFEPLDASIIQILVPPLHTSLLHDLLCVFSLGIRVSTKVTIVWRFQVAKSSLLIMLYLMNFCFHLPTSSLHLPATKHIIRIRSHRISIGFGASVDSFRHDFRAALASVFTRFVRHHCHSFVWPTDTASRP
jgi:hypothetical protein